MASSWRFLPLVAYLRRLQGGHNSPLPEPYRPSWIDGSTLVNKGNQPMLRKLVVVLTAGLFALAATACNTVKGVGEDIESVGEAGEDRSEEHTSELQSLMRSSYAVFGLQKKHNTKYPIARNQYT